ncbi:serine peptidase [Mycobacterium sp. PS03-16]|uniref:S8 family peptidase n=1 Tax=Mycobacterium sp. PS03-16 TaxID=2559611 RepID=UPI0010739EFF|nr:S8 family peptidase [Mycobacterium sp. PS03-16]TFV61563.1 serine peptidase [Mycobacterium sp. PS03-16]
MVSPLLLQPLTEIPDDAKETLLSDEDNGRTLVLVELRAGAGTDLASTRRRFIAYFERIFPELEERPVQVGRHYMRCALNPDEVRALVEGGVTPTSSTRRQAVELIYHVWPDFVIEAQLDRSLTTMQADAASRTFRCDGGNIVWAVLDSGIDGTHPHFATHGTLTADAVKTLHRDFTLASNSNATGAPLTDPYGHGTHVAGIIAGESPSDGAAVRIATNEPTAQDLPRWVSRTLPAGISLCGVAPRANLVSLRVLDDKGKTVSSVVIDALEYVRNTNSGGRDLIIHGVNLSLGCGWLPRDYGAGQSPLCRELDLLVGTGVAAVVSAGNLGAGTVGGGVGATVAGAVSNVYGQLSTITDPGNAAGAITVGSVHRYRPHTYGVTFDSSKGPTLDGRMKPDVVAPGERITSAATGQMADGVPPLQNPPGSAETARYIEDSGTSMAAAHVSGAIAAFLSARSEFIGHPDRVRQIFVDTATDLGRHPFYQGAGLVNLMRALTST